MPRTANNILDCILILHRRYPRTEADQAHTLGGGPRNFQIARSTISPAFRLPAARMAASPKEMSAAVAVVI